MAIIIRVLIAAILLAFWFCICGALWSQLLPLEMIFWIAGKFNIYGDEAIYNLAADAAISVSCILAIALTGVCFRFMRVKGWI